MLKEESVMEISIGCFCSIRLIHSTSTSDNVQVSSKAALAA